MIKFNDVLKVVAPVAKYIRKNRTSIIRGLGIVAGGGAFFYATTHAADTVHAIEEEGVKKGEPLTKTETAKVIFEKQWPAILMGAAYVTCTASVDIMNCRTIHDMKLTNSKLETENKGLIEQVSEMATMYNTVNTVKDAMSKKVEETHGVETVKQIENETIKETNDNSYKPSVPAMTPYISSRKMLEKANDMYMKTGDPKWKVREYMLTLTGQHFMSCDAYILDAAEEIAQILHGDKDVKELVKLNYFCEHILCGTSGIGEKAIWRTYKDRFGVSMYNIDDENDVSVRAVSFDVNPYIDVYNQYN